MPSDSRIFLGMGSNIDDRYTNLKKGIKLLNDHAHIWIIGRSHVYQSPAMYYLEQEDFYNMVIEIETNLNPLQLLDEINLMKGSTSGHNLTDDQISTAREYATEHHKISKTEP